MAAEKHVDLSGEVEPVAADTKRRLSRLPLNPPFPSEYRPTRPQRCIKILNTKPARGLERFDPFHSMHYQLSGLRRKISLIMTKDKQGYKVD